MGHENGVIVYSETFSLDVCVCVCVLKIKIKIEFNLLHLSQTL